MRKNKMILRVILLFIVIGFFTFFVCNYSNAAQETVGSIVGTVKPGNIDASDTKSFKDTIGTILGFLEIASGITAVIVIAFTGFNYIISTPSMKTELKQKMLPIVIGIILVFSAVAITKFILGVAG